MGNTVLDSTRLDSTINEHGKKSHVEEMLDRMTHKTVGFLMESRSSTIGLCTKVAILLQTGGNYKVTVNKSDIVNFIFIVMFLDERKLQALREHSLLSIYFNTCITSSH